MQISCGKELRCSCCCRSTAFLQHNIRYLKINIKVSKKEWRYNWTHMLDTCSQYSYRTAARASAKWNPCTDIVGIIICEGLMHVILCEPTFEWYYFAVATVCWPDMMSYYIPRFYYTTKEIFHCLFSPCTINTNFKNTHCWALASLSSGCHLQVLIYIYIIVSM